MKIHKLFPALLFKIIFVFVYIKVVDSVVEYCKEYLDGEQKVCSKCEGELIPNQIQDTCTCPPFMYLILGELKCTAICPDNLFENENTMICTEILQCPQQYLLGQGSHQRNIKGLATYNDKYLASFDYKTVILWDMQQNVIVNQFESSSQSIYPSNSTASDSSFDNSEVGYIPNRLQNDPSEYFLGIKFFNESLLIGWTNTRMMIWTVEQGYLEKTVDFMSNPSKFYLSDVDFAFDGLIFKDVQICSAYFVIPKILDDIDINYNEQQRDIPNGNNGVEEKVILSCNDTTTIQSLFILGHRIFGLTNNQNLFQWNYSKEWDQKQSSILIDSSVQSVKQYRQMLWYLKNSTIHIIEYTQNEEQYNDFEIQLKYYENYIYNDFVFTEKNNLIYLKIYSFIQVWQYDMQNKNAKCIIEQADCNDQKVCKDSSSLYYVSNNYDEFIIVSSKRQNSISIFEISPSSSDVSIISLTSQKPIIFDNKIFISSQFVYTYDNYIRVFTNKLNKDQQKSFQLLALLGNIADSKVYSQNFDQIQSITTTYYNSDLYYSLAQNELIGWSLSLNRAVYSYSFSVPQQNMVALGNIICTVSVITLNQKNSYKNQKVVYSIIMIRQDGFYQIGVREFEDNKEIKNIMIYQSYLVTASTKVVKTYYIGDINLSKTTLSSDKDQTFTEENEFLFYYNCFTGHFIQIFSTQGLITRKHFSNLSTVVNSVNIANLDQCEMSKYQENSSTLILVCSTLNQILVIDEKLKIISNIPKKISKKNSILGVYYQKELSQIAVMQREKFGVYDLISNLEVFSTQGNAQTVNLWQDFGNTGKLYILFDFRKYMIVDMYNLQKVIIQDTHTSANILKKIYYDRFSDRIFYIYQNKTIQYQQIENSSPILTKPNNINVTPFESKNYKVFLTAIKNLFIVSNGNHNKIRIYDYLQDTQLVFSVDFQFNVQRIITFDYIQKLLLISSRRQEVIIIDLININVDYQPKVFFVPENELGSIKVIVDAVTSTHDICFFDELGQIFYIYSFPDIVKKYSIDIKSAFNFVIQVLDLKMDTILTELQILVIDSQGRYYVIFYNYIKQTSSILLLKEKISELISIEYSHLYIVGIYQSRLSIFLRQSGEIFETFQPTTYTALSQTYSIDFLFHINYQSTLGIVLDFENQGNKIFQYSDWPEQLKKFLCFRDVDYVFMIESSSIAIADKQNSEVIFRYRMLDEQNKYVNYKYIEERGLIIVQFISNLVGYDILNLKLQFDLQILQLTGQFLYQLDINMILFCSKSDGSLQWLRYNSIEQLKESKRTKNQQLTLKVNQKYYLMVDDQMILWKFQIDQNKGNVFLFRFDHIILSLKLVNNMIPILVTQGSLYSLNIITNEISQYITNFQYGYFIVEENNIFEVGQDYIKFIFVNSIQIMSIDTLPYDSQGSQFKAYPVDIQDSQFDFTAQIQCKAVENTNIVFFLVSNSSKATFKVYIFQKIYNQLIFTLQSIQELDQAPNILFIQTVPTDKVFLVTTQSIHKFTIQQQQQQQPPTSQEKMEKVIKYEKQASLNYSMDQMKCGDKYIYLYSKSIRKIVVIDQDTLKKVYEMFAPSIDSNIQIISTKFLVVFTSYQINIYDLYTLQLKEILLNYQSIQSIQYKEQDSFFIIATDQGINFLNWLFLRDYYFQAINPIISDYVITFQLGIPLIKMILFSNQGLNVLNIPLRQEISPSINNCYINFHSKMKKYEQKQAIERIQSSINYYQGPSKYKITINYYTSFDAKPFIINEINNQGDKIRFRIFPQLSNDSEGNCNKNSLNLDLFQKYSLENLYIENFELKLPIPCYIQFNQKQSQIIVWQDITISNQDTIELTKQFQYSSQRVLFIKNLILINITAINNPIFDFYDQQFVTIKNVEIINSFQENTSLFSLKGQNSVLIEDITIKNLTMINSTLFTLVNVKSLVVKNITIQGFNNKQNRALEDNNPFKVGSAIKSNLFYLNGVYQLLIDTVLMQGMQDTYLLNTSNIFVDHSYNQELKSDSIELKNLYIFNNTLSKELMTIRSSFIMIFNSQFIDNRCEDCVLGSLLFLQSSKLLMSNISMINNTAVNGGAIFATQHSEINFIKDCTLKFNKAQAFGGAIYLEDSILNADNTSYLDYNSANVGGAIFITSDLECQDMVKQFQQQFRNNTALIYGNNCGCIPTKMVLFNATKIIQAKQVEDSYSYIINDFVSGGVIKLQLRLLDEENSVVQISKYSLAHQFVQNFLQRIKIIVMSGVQGIKLSGSMILNFQNTDIENNAWTFDDIRILGKPSASGYLIIYLENISDNLNQDFSDRFTSRIPNWPNSNKIPQILDQNRMVQLKYSIKLNITFRLCQIGEILMNDYQYQICFPCPEGFYSLQDHSIEVDSHNQCLKCPDQAKSCKGKDIQLKNGFWRHSNSTDSILYCEKNPSNCQAESEENKFYCKRGFVGPLCESCDIYGKVWGESFMKDKKNCVKCKEIYTFYYYIPLIIIFILMITYIVYQIKLAIKMAKGFAISYYLRRIGMISMGTSAVKDLTPFYVKQLIHFFQIANIVSVEELQLNKVFSFIPNLISLPVANFLYSFDCLFATIDEDLIQIAFLRIIWVFIIPIIYAITIAMMYSFMLLFKKQRFNKFFLSNGLFVLLLFIQPNVISSLLATVFCREIDGDLYIQADIMHKCLSQTHLKSIAIISIPGLFLWMIVIPFGIMYKLWKNRNRLNSVSMIFNFGFLFQEFKQKYYFWEFIKSYKKIIIVILNTTLQNNFYIKCSLIGIILLFYLLQTKRYRPYKMNRFNRIDRLLIIGLLFLIFLNICMQEITFQLGKFLCMIVNIGVYYAFLIYLIYTVVKSKLISRYQLTILQIKRNLKNKFPRIFSFFDISEPINTLRAHKNWKKVCNVVRNKKYQQLQIIRLGLSVDEFNNELLRRSTEFPSNNKNISNKDNQNNNQNKIKLMATQMEPQKANLLKITKLEVKNNDIQKHVISNPFSITQRGDDQLSPFYIKQVSGYSVISSQICSNNFLFQADKQLNEEQNLNAKQINIEMIENINNNLFSATDFQSNQDLQSTKQPSLEKQIENLNNEKLIQQFQSSPNSPNLSLIGIGNSPHQTPHVDFSYYENKNELNNNDQIKEIQYIQVDVPTVKDCEKDQKSEEQEPISNPLISEFVEGLNNKESLCNFDSTNVLRQKSKNVLNTQNTMSSIAQPLLNQILEQDLSQNQEQILSSQYQNQINEQPCSTKMISLETNHSIYEKKFIKKPVKKLYQNNQQAGASVKKLQPSMFQNYSPTHAKRQLDKPIKTLYQTQNAITLQPSKQQFQINNMNQMSNVSHNQNCNGNQKKTLHKRQLSKSLSDSFQKQNLSDQFKQTRIKNKKKERKMAYQNDSENSSEDEDSLNSSSNSSQSDNKQEY